jgi:hypothetical protein
VKHYTLSELKNEHPEGWVFSENKIMSMSLEICGHFYNCIWPKMHLSNSAGERVLFTGRNLTKSIGFIMRTLAIHLGCSEDDSLDLLKWFKNKKIDIFEKDVLTVGEDLANVLYLSAHGKDDYICAMDIITEENSNV